MNITDYLTDKTSYNTIQEVNNSPAVLFSNTSVNREFGDIYLFKNFGSVRTNTIKLPSQITTHYMEDNTARQDHWAIPPITYTLSGLIGELVYTPPTKWSNYVRNNFVDYLSPLGVLSPTFDSYTQSAINTIQAIEASFNRYKQIITQTLDNINGANIRKDNQGRVIEWLQSLRDNRQLVDVWTPYGTYYNLGIVDISATQNNSKYQSELEIQFTQWRNVSTQTRDATEAEKSLLAKTIQAQEQEQGMASTQEIKQTGLSAYFNWGDVRRK